MAYKRTPAKQAEMKENYNRLRAAGFSPLEASRLRSASEAKINAAIATGERPAISESHQRAGRGESYKAAEAEPVTIYGTHKGRIKTSDYKEVVEGYTKVYHDRYAYLMTYETDKNGVRERKYYTILSDEKLTKRDLVFQVIEACEDATGSQYEATLIHSSVKLVEAYHNEDFD